MGQFYLLEEVEAFCAEISREMLVTGNWLYPQFNFEAYTLSGTLFYWLQASSFSVFQTGEWAARLPVAVTGTILLPFLYISGKFLIDRRFGFLWALSWIGSAVPLLILRIASLDVLLNFFLFNALFFTIHYIWQKRRFPKLYFSKKAFSYLLLSGIALGLAMLTGGLVALLPFLLALGIYTTFNKFSNHLSFSSFGKVLGVALAIKTIWFFCLLAWDHHNYILEYFNGQWQQLSGISLGIQSIFQWWLPLFLLGSMPVLVFALAAMGKVGRLSGHIRDFQKWMIVLLVVGLLVLLSFRDGLSHYLSLIFYPLSFLSALSLWALVEKRMELDGRMKFFLALGLVLFAALGVFTPHFLNNSGQYAAYLPKYLQYLGSSAGSIDLHYTYYLPALIPVLAGVLFFALSSRRMIYAQRILLFGNALFIISMAGLFIPVVEAEWQSGKVEYYSSRSPYQGSIRNCHNKSALGLFYAQPAEAQAYPVLIGCSPDGEGEVRKQYPRAKKLKCKSGVCFYELSRP